MSFEPLYSPVDRELLIDAVSGMAPLLEGWYRENRRALPWRERPDSADYPYRVWLSEIMLQQTRVETVIPYYHRFLAAVPDIAALAEAEEALLHKLWEGLGYYSRVRNLQKGARQVMAEFGGQLPADVSLLKKICGIGEYTAGAIGSIAFGICEPAVDGNLCRVTARLAAAEGDIMKPAVKKAVHDLLLIGMERSGVVPGDFNQAMMDLGSGVCTPVGPDCRNCPISRFCLAHERGQETLFPVKAKAKERRIEEKTVLVIIVKDRVLLQKRPETGLLAGLWELPSSDGRLDADAVREQLRSLGLTVGRLLALKDAKHIFTHIEWRMKGFLAVCGGDVPEGMIPVTAEELEENYMLPSAFKVYRTAAMGMLTKRNGNKDGEKLQEELL